MSGSDADGDAVAVAATLPLYCERDCSSLVQLAQAYLLAPVNNSQSTKAVRQSCRVNFSLPSCRSAVAAKAYARKLASVDMLVVVDATVAVASAWFHTPMAAHVTESELYNTP